jgi:hypothetical protein
MEVTMKDVMEKAIALIGSEGDEAASAYLRSLDDAFLAVETARRLVIAPYLNWAREQVNTTQLEPATLLEYIRTFDRFAPENAEGLLTIYGRLFAYGLQEKKYAIALRAVSAIVSIDEGKLDLPMRLLSLRSRDFEKELSEKNLSSRELASSEKEVLEALRSMGTADEALGVLLAFMHDHDLTVRHLESTFYQILGFAFDECAIDAIPLLLLQEARNYAEKSYSNREKERFNAFLTERSAQIQKRAAAAGGSREG